MRYGIDGLKMTCHQSPAISAPPSITWPAGVCIHELSAMIQNADIDVPTATMAEAKICTHDGTRFMPNSITPRKVASRKKAISTSKASSGPATLPTASMNPGQLVPNWNDIVIPDTAPIANDSANTLVHNW